MEYLLLTVVIIFVIIIMSNRSKGDIRYLSDLIGTLSHEIRGLKKEINSLRDELDAAQRRALKQTPRNDPPDHEAYKPQPGIIFMPPPPDPEPAQPAAPDVVPLAEADKNMPVVPLPVYEQEILSLHDPEPAEPVAAFSEPTSNPGPANAAADTPPEESWLSKNPDLEKFIGENLINKIGIAVLVLGIAFFVKYAIDKDWINETGRVCIGLGCGAILAGLAHFLRKSYRSFSSVLAGGGIAVFYFTIAFAFHQYHLMSQTAAFIVMVVITAFAVALSVLYDKLELAVIACIGGFITPFLVSTGDGNYIVLFTYLAILNIGLMALAWFKRWPAINVISLFFTLVIYGGWLGTTISAHKPVSYPLALMFASIFYVLFLGMNMINQVKTKDQFRPFDFSILLLISGCYYAAGMILLHAWNGGTYQGIFTLCMGIINLGLAYYVYRKGKTDRNLLFFLIGLTFSFVTLTIPIQLHGHAITMFWSAEFVLLFWLSEYSGIRLFRYTSILVCLLTLLSLLIDWNKETIRSTSSLLIIFSDARGIITNIVAVAAFGIYYMLLRKNNDNEYVPGFTNRQAGPVALIIGVALLYITCVFGVNLWHHNLHSYEIPNVYHRMITEIFALVLLVLIQKNRLRAHAYLQLALFAACFLYFLVSAQAATHLRDHVLTGHSSMAHLYAHWAGSILLIALFYRLIQGVRNDTGTLVSIQKGLAIFISIAAIVFLSMELAHIYILIGYNKNNTHELARQYGKAGLSALWGICSFALMWLGMKHRQKTLRIISLTVFSIVLLKLFILDISGISEGGKIFAFILLGVLLLVVSFMYQKLKKIIIDDRKE